jgi:ribosome-binding protein aMBF1 (putative translation factor)
MHKSFKPGQFMTPTPHEIVRNAWKKTGLSQSAFASKHGITQYNLSRYASGKVKPPDDLLMQCMHILGLLLSDDISARELSDLIQAKLARPDHAVVRRAVFDLLSMIS